MSTTTQIETPPTPNSSLNRVICTNFIHGNGADPDLAELCEHNCYTCNFYHDNVLNDIEYENTPDEPEVTNAQWNEVLKRAELYDNRQASILRQKHKHQLENYATHPNNEWIPEPCYNCTETSCYRHKNGKFQECRHHINQDLRKSRMKREPEHDEDYYDPINAEKRAERIDNAPIGTTSIPLWLAQLPSPQILLLPENQTKWS